jgi:hypothetical protein
VPFPTIHFTANFVSRSLHWLEVSEAAKASLILLPANAGPIRSVDTTTTTAIAKLTIGMFRFMVKLILENTLTID